MSKITSFSRNKLSKQLLIGFGLSLLAVGSIAISITYLSLRHNLEQQVRQRAQTITQGIEFATEGLLEDKETFLLERIVQNYATLPSVLEISIVDPNGYVLAHSHKIKINGSITSYGDIQPTLNPSFQQASRTGRAINILTVLDGKPVIVQFLPFSSALFDRTDPAMSSKYRGVTIAVMDLQQLEKEALKNALLTILAMTVSGSMILLFMGWLISRLILTPLTEIQLAIANHEQQKTLDLKTFPDNEIGFLGSTLASVFGQLNEFKQMELEIAERKYIEVAKRYELATQAAKVWVWEWDIQSDKFVLEQGIQEWLGYEHCQIPSQFQIWLNNVYSEDRQLFYDNLQDNLNGKTPEFACEHRLLKADGNVHWFLSRGQSVLDDRGQALKAIGTITDIDDRKQAEKLIQQQAERESLLLEITKKIRQTLDLQTIFNTAVSEIREFLVADRVGIFKFDPDSHFNDGEFVSESVLPPFDSAIAIKIHDHCFGDQYAALYQQGQIQNISDIHNAGLTDCHIKVLAQFQIQANLVIPLLNADRLWGLICIQQCSSTRIWQGVEIDFIQQIANQLAIAIQQATLFEQLQQELNERHQTEIKLVDSNQKLAISNDELSRATRLKDEFLANMSHELRTPLNSILGMTEILKDQIFGEVNERQNQSLQTVENSATHLLALINDILDVAKIESGQVTLELTATSIKSLCKSSLSFVKQQALNKRIQLIDRIPAYLPELMLDERRIRQVLINLLNNAVKFTPEGGNITLEVSQISSDQADVFSNDAPNYLRIAVIDTGIGISAENIQKLFQPFIQIDSALNRQYVGTGLGLALVKRSVELHGGEVELLSELGVGSQFIVNLPFKKAITSQRYEPSHNPKIESAQESKQLGDILILLAEDNEANVMTFSSYLKAMGYQLLIAKDGQTLIDLAKKHQPDVIITDIQMPIIDGIEAIKQIRLDSNLVNVQIIALTALAMKGDREKCLEAGANEYLSKPIKLKQLAITIQGLLNSRLQTQDFKLSHLDN